jgi:hypothetical protein
MCSTSKCLYSVGRNSFSLYYYSSTDDRLILSCMPQCTKKCISVGTKSDIMLYSHSLLAIMCSCKCRDGANQNKSGKVWKYNQ